MKVERMLATLAARRMKPLSMSIARASDAESIAPPSRNLKSLRSIWWSSPGRSAFGVLR